MIEKQNKEWKNRKGFAKELEKRTLKFAVSIIKLSARLPNTVEGKVVRNQVTKSGTSIGANYREANRSRSRADFKNKIKICESEASETQYWLELIIEAGWLTAAEINVEYDECSQLLALFSTIAKNC
jgi:four helix bundle protein